MSKMLLFKTENQPSVNSLIPANNFISSTKNVSIPSEFKTYYDREGFPGHWVVIDKQPVFIRLGQTPQGMAQGTSIPRLTSPRFNEEVLRGLSDSLMNSFNEMSDYVSVYPGIDSLSLINVVLNINLDMPQDGVFDSGIRDEHELTSIMRKRASFMDGWYLSTYAERIRNNGFSVDVKGDQNWFVELIKQKFAGTENFENILYTNLSRFKGVQSGLFCASKALIALSRFDSGLLGDDKERSIYQQLEQGIGSGDDEERIITEYLSRRQREIQGGLENEYDGDYVILYAANTDMPENITQELADGKATR